MSGKRLAVLAASAFLLSAAAAQAITPAQLTSPFFPDAGITVEIKDVQQLIKNDKTPLEQFFSHFLFPSLKSTTDSGVSAELDKVVSCTGRLRYRRENEKENDESFVWALELSEPIASGRTADFSLDARPPEGTTLQPFAMISGKEQDDGEEENRIYMAQMGRGEQHFLLVSDNPALLSVMAGVPDSTNAEERRIAGQLWLGIDIPPSEISQIVNPALLPDLLSSPLFIEAAVSGTERSILLDVQFGSRENGYLPQLREMFSGDRTPSSSAPLLVGGGSLLGLLSFENIFDADKLDKIRSTVEGSLKETGLNFDDLKEVLKGRITLGIAGTTSTPLGRFPGIYLHLSGANSHVCSVIMEQFEKGTAESKIKTEPFSTGPWKGLRNDSWALFSGYAAEGNGLIIGLQDSSELLQTPDVAADMKDVLADRPQLTLNIDFTAIGGEISDLFHRIGGLLLSDEDKETADEVLKMIDILGVFNLTASDKGTAHAELFVREPQFVSFLDALAAE